MTDIAVRIAGELAVRPQQIVSALALLDEGATVPFIARYRKEVTGGLDDTQLRRLEERLGYLRQLEDRRATVLKTIADQGKLTSDLERTIRAADDRITLEDLYAPYKPKRRTKAQIAREAGLEPLADLLMSRPDQAPESHASSYVNSKLEIETIAAALEGARAIVIERISENAELVGALRTWLWTQGRLSARVVKGKHADGAKFADYFDFSQAIRDLPSHRALAMLRGRNEGVLRLDLDVEAEKGTRHPAELKISAACGVSDRGRPGDAWQVETVRQAWKGRLHKSLSTDLLARLKDEADRAAIDVFKSNLKDLLLSAPAGPRVTLGLDPGIRTGVKAAVVDETGKLQATATIYPHQPRNDWAGALASLAGLCDRHGVAVIAIGNGTASRETDRLVADLLRRLADPKPVKVMVSEAGASVYSASEAAAAEFSDLDVSLRGAVSIARRLQDPLAELVKIDPKAIGVGQYQHDVDQADLARSLDAVVEDCVNGVGVDVNTASAPLLARVAGLNTAIARNLVAFRDENGAFKKRTQIKKVPRLGPKAFEQAAGFLRIMNGPDALDASAVHPEAYPVVQQIGKASNRSVKSMIGDTAFLKSVDPARFANDVFGIPTITDILAELEKPGRDPRPDFRTATFQDGVDTLADLQPGMVLEGVVTNVTDFGAFVDVGVHQDGLVHVSELADRFVKNPRDVVKTGLVVRVRVKDVDVDRKRIGLSMKSGDPDARRPERTPSPPKTAPAASADRAISAPGARPAAHKGDTGLGESALAAALRRAQQK